MGVGYMHSCCSPSSSAATRAFVITIISLLATALLISFDAVFIALPSTCILTSSCVSNSAQTSGWSYTLSSSFLTTFKTLSPFTNYTSTSAKYLFQTIQLGVGCLCFVLSVIYVILYLIYKSKAKKSIYPQTQPPAMYQQQQQFNPNFNPQGIRRGPPPRNPQAYPGEIEWS
ncbi:unnamed protein product [Didymodactylos carnosus]|uniref:Uncharacterized protein n=1 Tax=Didymodactylos carnosus TaxID=1234261 RepID=A0A8S2FFZ5_9BILA|nr:unnamed protein product [Didymodactylos carnosus]CAF4247895.1 unnamed protein product [Didymodactylos carnosus]